MMNVQVSCKSFSCGHQDVSNMTYAVEMTS